MKIITFSVITPLLLAFAQTHGYPVLGKTLGATVVAVAAQVSFTATPTSGPAPLAAFFKSTGSPGTDIGSTVNFGDGATDTLTPAPICAGCNPQAFVRHTYPFPGSYNAVLLSSSGNMLAAVTITVTGH
jgi:hypothetical protein